MRFRGKADEVERNSRALARSKVEFENLNAKFTAAMEDIDTLRKTEAARADAAAKYPVLPKEEPLTPRLKAIK